MEAFNGRERQLTPGQNYFKNIFIFIYIFKFLNFDSPKKNLIFTPPLLCWDLWLRPDTATKMKR
jgi:hypothetical protein